MPIGFPSEAWPRPGLAEPRSASIAGFGLFHQHIRKGKIVITKTSKEKRLLLGSFLAPETDMIFGDGVGASLVGWFLHRVERKKLKKKCDFTCPGNRSHEMRVDRQKLRKNCDLACPGGTLLHEMRVDRKTEDKLRFSLSQSNPFARNEENWRKIAILRLLEQPFRTKWHRDSSAQRLSCPDTYTQTLTDTSGTSKFQFLPIDLIFVQKGCSGTRKVASLPQFFG